DSKDQKDRDRALAALERLIVGKPAPKFELRGLRRDVVSSKDLKDTVTVLHFWEYRDSPLREPYGQIGYLDYLNRRFKEKNVAIFGVMVDERIGNPATLGRARASARKLKAFMNLSYNVLLDEGSLLKQFGDPRVTGAKLPLYVVFDASGKVVHYHSGFYEIDRDHGLKELADVIMKSLETGE
ncbi:MAG: TlpA family protein disulfide reductase, partial [Planctomycetes bacterium]|nr:TlpA family protein disulfide reductase [Planctomycetota bacterium]